jgi:hypothetical protein
MGVHKWIRQPLKIQALGIKGPFVPESSLSHRQGNQRLRHRKGGRTLPQVDGNFPEAKGMSKGRKIKTYIGGDVGR